MKHDAILCVRSVSKSYGGPDKCTSILNAVDLSVRASEIVAIVGASGSGKTTFLSICGGLESDFTGSVHILGRNIRELTSKDMNDFRRHQLGFLLQRPFLIQELTVCENVMVAGLLANMTRGEARARAHALLQNVLLDDNTWNMRPSILSPGQQQRVAVARALMSKPRLIFCDEPTASLDCETASAVMDVLCTMAQDCGSSIVVATHDQAVSKRAHRVVRLRSGVLEAYVETLSV